MNFEQLDDRETIINLLENDDIQRNKYLLNFIKIMNNNGKNRVFSLNGNWGSGKTFFVRKLETLIKYCYMYKDKELMYENIYSETEEFKENEIERLSSIVNRKEYIEFNKIIKEKLINCVYFNAWEHDDEDEPILSIIYEFIKKYNLFDETQDYKLEPTLDTINKIIKFISFGKVELNGKITKEDLCNGIQKKEKIKEAVNQTIENLISEKCNKLIIFIDELDRCNPNYAVKLLERIKHYFVDERLIIVISTNLTELSNTISCKYGEGFSSTKYLDKFFDIRLELPRVNVDKYIETLDSVINKYDKTYFTITISGFIKANKLEQREINHYLGCIRFFENNAKEIKNYIFDKYLRIIDYLFIPYIIGLYVTNIEEYNDFKNALCWNKLETFIQDNDLINFCRKSLYDVIDHSNKQSDELVMHETKKLYELAFDNGTKKTRNKVGDQEININLYDYMEEKISILGALSNFK